MKYPLVQISAIRLIAMILIILCHIFQFYELDIAWWLNVGVQIFLILSGFLYGTKEINDPIKWTCKRLSKILIPYYVLLVIYFIVCLFGRVRFPIPEVWRSFFALGNLPGLSHLWFVSTILFCYIITPFLYQFVEKTKGKLSAIVLSTVIYIAVSSIINAYFRHHFICCYIVGFYLGYYWRRFNYASSFISSTAYIIVPFGIVVNVARCVIEYLCPELLDNIPIPLWVLYSNYGHLLLGLSLFCILFLACSSVKYNCGLKFSDTYSYDIYLTHHLMILSPFTLMTLTDSVTLNLALVLLGTLSLSLIVHWLTHLINTSFKL